LRVEAPNERQIQAGIIGDDELTGRVRGYHVQMRAIMIADGKLPGRIVDGTGTMPGSDARPHIRCLAESPVGAHRKHRNVAAAIVGDEHELA
jgi:hypothetical protein